MDLEIDFDNIKRHEIWNVLNKRGINRKQLELIKNIYSRTENVVSNWQNIQTWRGVRLKSVKHNTVQYNNGRNKWGKRRHK